MTVERLLGEISQKELCHWIAFFRLENEEYEDKKAGKEPERGKPPKAQKPDEPAQVQKDNLLFQQLMMIAAGRGREERNSC